MIIFLTNPRQTLESNTTQCAVCSRPRKSPAPVNRVQIGAQLILQSHGVIFHFPCKNWTGVKRGSVAKLHGGREIRNW